MKRLTLALALAFASAGPAAAHHGWSSYDETSLVTLEGKIAQVTYGNPHGELTLATDRGDMTVILAPPSRMQARGLTADMLVADKSVTVEGYINRDTRTELRAERITVDGTTVELR